MHLLIRMQKSDIEARRSGNAWGTVTWQLNEIWPTGGWGSLEYGTTGFTAGQVLGGRWKPLHHWMASHLYRDTVLICGSDAACLVKHDGAITGFNGSWTTTLLHIADGSTSPLGSGTVTLPRGAGAVSWMCADGHDSPASCTPFSNLLTAAGCAPSGSDCIMQVTVTEVASGVIADSHIVLLTAPANMILPNPSLTLVVAAASNADASVNVSIASPATALFVTLTTTEPGIFSDNAFLLTAGEVKELQLQAIQGAPPPDPAKLRTTLRADHVAKYTQSPCK